MAHRMNILVTGGAGFLGSHVADALTDQGHRVTILDQKESPYQKAGQKFVKADILDRETVNRLMKGMDAVFHLAAFADLDAAHDAPYMTMQTNVMGANSVLEACRLNSVKRIVLASTIYVNSRTGSFYRVSKHACELLLEAYHERYGLDFSILRFGTLYGTRANDHNSVNKILKEALVKKELSFAGSGEEVREYIHVADAAQICAKILDDKFAGQTLIITGHHRMKVSEMLDIVNEIMGGKLKITYDPTHSKSHYRQTPYSYIPRVGKKIALDTYCDFGQSLVEILDEINSSSQEAEIRI